MVTENGQVQPRIRIQGQIAEIGISIKDADMVSRRDGDDDQPVVFTFKGRNDKFINIFDHRREVIAAWAQYQVDKDRDRLDAAFAACPCLGRMAEKTARYIVLADLGTADMWEEGDEPEMILTRGGEFNRADFTVPNEAIHVASGICFIVPKPPKPEKVEVEPESEEAPVNPQMAELLGNLILAK